MSFSPSDFEHELATHLERRHFDALDATFACYQASQSKGNDFSFYKSIVMLHKLVVNDMVGYYSLAQTISIDEMKKEMISFVINVEEQLNRCNVDGLDQIGNECDGINKELVKELVRNFKERLDSKNITESIKGMGKTHTEEEYLKMIRDCVYMSQNKTDN